MICLFSSKQGPSYGPLPRVQNSETCIFLKFNLFKQLWAPEPGQSEPGQSGHTPAVYSLDLATPWQGRSKPEGLSILKCNLVGRGWSPSDMAARQNRYLYLDIFYHHKVHSQWSSIHTKLFQFFFSVHFYIGHYEIRYNKCIEGQKVQKVLTENKYTEVHQSAPRCTKKRKMEKN